MRVMCRWGHTLRQRMFYCLKKSLPQPLSQPSLDLGRRPFLTHVRHGLTYGPGQASYAWPDVGPLQVTYVIDSEVEHYIKP
jgi:hypothetical protein